jgi:hypothetical protein
MFAYTRRVKCWAAAERTRNKTKQNRHYVRKSWY